MAKPRVVQVQGEKPSVIEEYFFGLVFQRALNLAAAVEKGIVVLRQSQVVDQRLFLKGEKRYFVIDPETRDFGTAESLDGPITWAISYENIISIYETLGFFLENLDSTEYRASQNEVR